MKSYTLEIRPEDEATFTKEEQKKIPNLGDSIALSQGNVQIVDRAQYFYEGDKKSNHIIIFTKKG
jgi:hypothetical protein